MKHNDDTLQKELKALKQHRSLNPQKKEQMKSAIQKHARKKRKRRKIKQVAIWTATAAALLLAGVFIYSLIDNDQSVLPADDHDERDHDNSTGDKEPETIPEEPGFSVHEAGTKSKIIMIEGMEEEVMVTNYILEPYGIHYQIEEFLNNYQVEKRSVRYYTEAENSWVRLQVAENASLDDVVSNVQNEYSDDFTYTEEPAETSLEENPYAGMKQHYSDPPQGYVAYQIGENVLLIQYEYIIEAGDGMGPRLQALRESIEQKP